MDVLLLGGIRVTGLVAIVAAMWLPPLAAMAALAAVGDQG